MRGSPARLKGGRDEGVVELRGGLNPHRAYAASGAESRGHTRAAHLLSRARALSRPSGLHLHNANSEVTF